MPIGKIEPFDVNSKQWPAYVRRVKQFILLNQIEENLQVPMLITVVGEATYSLMCDLCTPDHPENKSFDQLVKLVTDHLEPQRSEIAERHVFRQRRQRQGETLMEYLQQLKHLAATCNFGTRLEENLRDQFVSGLMSDIMRSRIFAEKNVDYGKAVELALALEAAEKHAEVSASAALGQAGTSREMGEGLHTVQGRRTGRAGAGGGVRAPSAAVTGSCWRCGKAHRADRCRFANYNCDQCNQRGHLKVMCNKVSYRDKCNRRQHFMDQDTSEDEFFNMAINSQGNKPYYITVTVGDRELKCEIDTGSRISAINEECYRQLFNYIRIERDNLILRSYSGSRIEPLGYILVDVKLKDVYAKNLVLYVIKGGGGPLLGRDWLRALKITQININEVVDDQFVTRLCKDYPDVFSDQLGTCTKSFRLELADCDSVYVRARPVPLALRERVERELSRLEHDGTIYRVEHSDFGTPIVPVIKSNGEIRICGDYKITINPKLKRDYYPLPRIEELFAILSNGEEYTKIDLKHAYEQVLLELESQRFTAITTHLGTFAYRRTPYGLSCVPEKFQKLMEETLRGVPGTVVFLDDICVTGRDRQAHVRNLRAVLERLRQAGLTVKLDKCKFLEKRVTYLGFIIDKLGLHPDPTKLEAISSVPTPTNVTQLKSFLGLLNYYGKFIPNLSSLIHPLNNLLRKGESWHWDSHCQEAFKHAKEALLGDRVLAHYEEGRPLVLAVDSSSYGVGAVLAHRYDDGSERPVSCASRTLNDAEKNYSQLDKEALAIFFGITKNHQYLYGRRFVLRTDHKPLTYIFGEKSGIPQTAASRLQRWAARLTGYDFKIEFVRSENNGPADALSRLPLSHERHCTSSLEYLHFVEDSLPINFKEVAKETGKDPLLSKIVGYVTFGWPLSVAGCEEERCFFSRRDNLFIDLGCLIYKYRIIIPPRLRSQVLSEIHEGHLGMNKMKNISRNYVYWPNIDRDIEETCRKCDACRAVRDAPARAPLHPWEFPLHPWRRIHADFADCAGKRFLIIVDAYSKWMEALEMGNITAATTIKVFRSIFARFGIPSQLVTDNGPPFFSEEFKLYCKNNAIKHTTSSPYRPQGNGEAENAVKTIKKAIKRALYEKVDISTALSRFLFQYRNCEHATTGVAPAVALQGRRLRGRLDALRPDPSAVVREAQDKQVAAAGGRLRQLQVGEAVLARNFTSKGNKWSEGRISEITGPVSYKIQLKDGSEWRRHQDQITPIRKKNRYSLSRTSTVIPEAKNDAAHGGDVDEGEEPDGGDNGEPSAGSEGDDSDYGDAEDAPIVTDPSAPTSDASAREWRAYKRSLRNNKK